jgi:hypothetical protein
MPNKTHRVPPRYKIPDFFSSLLEVNLHCLQTSAPPFPIGSLVRDLNSSESGPGRIIAWNQDGIVTVSFEWSGAIHRMRLPECKLTRATGFSVAFQSKLQLQVTRARPHLTSMRPLGFIPYRAFLRRTPLGLSGLCGSEEEVLPETALIPLGALSGDPVGRFEAHGWRGPRPFFNRWALRQVTAQWFEAGLVIQSLIAENSALKVLVIAAGTMTRQWQSELYLRFGARAYRHIDASMFRENRILAEKVSEEDRLIVSTTALEQHSSLQEALASKLWDLVVVDEAHQSSPDTGLYSVVRKLAENSYGFLALSATPSKREIDSLIGLLSLVAPGAYDLLIVML